MSILTAILSKRAARKGGSSAFLRWRSWCGSVTATPAARRTRLRQDGGWPFWRAHSQGTSENPPAPAHTLIAGMSILAVERPSHALAIVAGVIAIPALIS